MDDNELMTRLKLGDLDALTELVDRHRQWGETLADSMLHDPSLAEDVVQEAFARVYLLRQRYEDTFCFRTYLGVLVRRLCIDQIRRRKRAPLLTEDVPEAAAPSAESAYLAREKRLLLWSLIEALPDADRALLTGYALEGKSCRELAKEQGMSVVQVKGRLHRIRRRLKAKERDVE